MRREAAARKDVEEARQAVIKACADLRETEMFLDAVKADERSAVGGEAARVASSADVANTHQSNIREQVQPCKVLPVDHDHEVYAESRLLEAASALQKAALVLGSPHIRHWFDEGLLARAQDDILQIQVAMLAKLQRLNARAIKDLYASQGTARGADGSSSSASSSAHSSGAEGSRGLPGASAHTPAGHTVQVSKYKFLRRREDGSARD